MTCFIYDLCMIFYVLVKVLYTKEALKIALIATGIFCFCGLHVSCFVPPLFHKCKTFLQAVLACKNILYCGTEGVTAYA